MNRQTKTITIDGVSVRTVLDHTDTDTAWVYLHGWGSRKEVWNSVVTEINQTQVFVDLPGFGESDDLSKPWNINDYASIIDQLIEKMDYSSVVLVGHSFGGQIAVAVAANQPEKLAGLVLVNAAAIRDSQPKVLSTIGGWLSPLFDLPGVCRLKHTLYDWLGVDRPPSDPNLKKTMRNILRSDQTDILSDIHVPTRVIWGLHDTVTPLDHGKKIAEQIPDAELSVLDGTHYIFVDKPEQFVQEITNFQQVLSS